MLEGLLGLILTIPVMVVLVVLKAVAHRIRLCRGNVESSRGRGAIELRRVLGFRDEGGSDVGKEQGLPSFGSHDGGVILRAAINHYKAILPVTVDVLAEIEVLVEIARV